MMRRQLLISSSMLLCLSVGARTDKYRLIITGDPATSITIGWNQVSGMDPMVCYDTIDFGLDCSRYAFYHKVDHTTNFRGMSNRFVTLEDLQPNTAYYFLVNDSEGNSERFWFKTAPVDNSRLSFIAGGDSRSNPVPRRNANLLVSKLKPHAVLFGGDMTNNDTDIEWKDWMDDWQLTIATDGRMIPILPTRGNHDAKGVLTNLFHTDSNEYFGITFGNNLVRTYTLNTEVSVFGNQLDWLKNDLESQAGVRWKIAQYHKPMRPHTESKSEGNAEYQAWSQIFYDHHVNLIIECDSHMAQTSWPVKPSTVTGSVEGFIRDDLKGTVYTGQGCWGAPLRPANDNKTWTRNSGSFNQFKLIFVETDMIEVRTILVQNAEEVDPVSNEDPFRLPDNLDIWEPSNGAVVEILPPSTVENIDVAFSNPNYEIYPSGEDLTIGLDIINQGAGIRDVAFYVEGVLIQIDDTAPFSFSHNYQDGNVSIEAVATDDLLQTDVDLINIIVGSFTDVASFPIINGLNDVEETGSGWVLHSSSDLELVYDDFSSFDNIPNGFQMVGLRFAEVSIPKGANIHSAYIQFRSDETDDSPAQFILNVEDEGSPEPFNIDERYNVSERSLFSEGVLWQAEPFLRSGLTGIAQRTPDLSHLIEKIIDDGDWETGNPIVVTIQGDGSSLTSTDSKRVADSSEGSASSPPTLVIEYSFSQGVTTAADEEAFTAYSLYPNPFDQTITVRCECSQDIDKILIYNLNGRQIVHTEYKSEESAIQILLPQLEKGIYLMEGIRKGGERAFTEKLVRL